MPLQWVNISSLFGQGLLYHTCPNVTWKQHLWNEEYGPADTFVWFHNPCESSTSSVTFNVSRFSNGVPHFLPACNKLELFCARVLDTVPVSEGHLLQGSRDSSQALGL